MPKKMLKSVVGTRNLAKHRITWKDVEHQIFDEDSEKIFEIRLFGIRFWGSESITDIKHTILKNEDKGVGFGKNKNRE